MADDLKSLKRISEMVGGLALNKVQATKLNKATAVVMRKYTKSRFTQEKDIHGKRFRPKKKAKFTQAASGKISLNKKMFIKASKLVSTSADANNASVGWMNKRMNVLKIHNEGLVVDFKHPNTGTRVNYKMPKREFLGWSPEMVKQVEQAVVDQYLKFQGA